MRSIIWWQVLLGMLLGVVFGQRFSHLHPVPSVKAANGG